MPTGSTPNESRIPPGQQLVAPGKWPVIGQREPSDQFRPWTLNVSGEVDNPVSLSLEELRQLPQHSQSVDIHCVTRWSKLDAQFSGVRFEQIAEMAAPHKDAKFVSFVSRTNNSHSSSLEIQQAVDLQTIIALDYQNEPLDIGHGGPIRCIVPGRYFYKSVKWTEQIEFLSEDRLGGWEADSGYHNQADPWLEQRYMSPTINKRLAAELIRSKDFSKRDLRSIDASKRDLQALIAIEASLRDANFCDANLAGANFEQANLSNAHFDRANLNGANFRTADVEGADFSGADLRGADFIGASLVGASFFRRESEDTDLLAAQIDSTTQIPEEAMAKLFPVQFDFVKQQLKT